MAASTLRWPQQEKGFLVQSGERGLLREAVLGDGGADVARESHHVRHVVVAHQVRADGLLGHNRVKVRARVLLAHLKSRQDARNAG